MQKLSGRRVRRSKPADYALADPHLMAFDHGLGTLRVDGEQRGYLASVVGQTQSSEPLLWFVVVWNDRTKETPFEDYGPKWLTVRELDAGYVDHFEPSTTSEGRFLGFSTVRSKPGATCRFEFEWLPTIDAAEKWLELGLVEEDF